MSPSSAMRAQASVLVILALLGVHDAQQPPTSPCPSVFRYEWDADQEGWRGVVTIVPPTLFSALTLQVRTTLTFYRKNAGDGEIKLADDPQELASWVFLRERRPVHFHVTFPPYRNLPTLSAVNINGKDFCPPIPNPADAVHIITLEYKLQSGMKGAAAPGSEYQTEEEFEAGNDKSLKLPPPPPPSTPPHPPTPAPGMSDVTLTKGPPCGQAAAQPMILITNAVATEKGKWPWHVGMYQVVNGDSIYICGSTLVSLGTVVTAAHCVTQGGKTVDPSTRMLFFGKYTWELFGEKTVQQKEVSRIIAHPNYSGETYQSDIAIMIPSSPVTFTNFVRPICLWKSLDIDVRAIEGRTGTVVGWGVDEDGEKKSELQIAHLPIVPKQTCVASNVPFYSTYTSDNSFCVGNGAKSDVNVCSGDSGGGLYLDTHNPDGSVAWQLRGIVSLSPQGNEEKIRCDPRQYSVFTDSAQFLPFIKQYLR